MILTQNEKISQVSDETLVIGVDIGSESHYARAFDNRGREVAKLLIFYSDIFGFNCFFDWVVKLMEKNSKTNVIIGAEPTGHYWFTFAEYLNKKELQFVFVNPMHVKKTKELDDNHPSKSDRLDPKPIAKLVIEGRYLMPYIPEDIYAELRVANDNRIRIMKEMVATENRIARWFAIYFPEYKRAFADWSCISSITLLTNASTPKEIIALGSKGINKLWRDKKIRGVGINKAEAVCRAANISVGVKSGGSSAKFEIEILLEDFIRKQEQLNRITEIIETLVIQIPNAEKLIAIKGVGLVTVAGFLAEVGDISRFKSPLQIQKLAGYAITENSSGKHKGQTCISKRGRKHLRQVLFQVGLSLIRHNDEFKELHKYYTTRNNNPLKKKQSVVALACKLIRVFFVIMTKGVDYNGEKLVSDIVREQKTA